MGFGASILAGLLTGPAVTSACDHRDRRVPANGSRGFRDASLASAPQSQTICVVLPGALPGHPTGAILSIGRAAGETAPILFTAAVFFQRDLPNSVFSPVMALPYHLYIMATQVPKAPAHIQWGTALVLIVIVLLANTGATVLRSRLRRSRNY